MTKNNVTKNQKKGFKPETIPSQQPYQEKDFNELISESLINPPGANQENQYVDST